MENIETAQQQEQLLTITTEIKHYLLETSRWGKFLAIVGYVGMGLLFLLGVVFLSGFSSFSSASSTFFPMRIVGLIYLILPVLYYFPIRYLYNYSVQVKQGLIFTNQQAVTSGFKNLKSIFKFMGIFMIVVLSIYALIIIIAVPLAIFSAFR